MPLTAGVISRSTTRASTAISPQPTTIIAMNAHDQPWLSITPATTGPRIVPAWKAPALIAL